MKKKLGLPIFYRINKFIKFHKFSNETIFKLTNNEIKLHVDECNGLLDERDVYDTVSRIINIKDENPLTVKNKVQAVAE